MSMSTPRHSEAAFETVIEHHLLAHGYVAVSRDGFDRSRAIFPSVVLDFIKDTQPREWAKLEALHGPKTGEQILTDLCKWMDANGSLATLRHGFKCYGRTLFVAYFKAAHELNPELEERYARNRLGLTRQLRFSSRSGKSLDVTLSVNGIPIATLELKNAMTKQTVDDARRQYVQDRDPREPIFDFKRRTLVHFAVDTDAVLMTTRLAGSAIHFLPFNKGDGGGGRAPTSTRPISSSSTRSSRPRWAMMACAARRPSTRATSSSCSSRTCSSGSSSIASTRTRTSSFAS
jgi:type I restriction enzyme R subunit